ncbi:NAD(P)/FAD-dependent oxidoreductase [Rhodococcus aetherivorans]
MAELDRLGLGDWVRTRTVNRGLRLEGFGRSLELPWPSGSFPAQGSAVPRTELDDRIRRAAVESGAGMAEGAKAVAVERDESRVTGVTFATAGGRRTVACERLVVADGVRSPLGKLLGGSGTATRRTGSRPAPTPPPPAATTRGSRRTWSYATTQARCTRATAGCSHWVPARSTSAWAPSRPRSDRPPDRCGR